ncbi:MAG: hypothetical protein JXC31_05670 [Acholeplasmataceae bacterium]|nr:hypothetical protein [Acholeplasmataceae bacterium]
MENRSKQTLNRLVMVSVVYLVLALFIFTVVVFAWYTLTDINRANLVSQISGVEAEYEFYVYRDSDKDGSDHQTLIDNVCSIGEDKCYEFVTNPTFSYLIPGYAAPGERFSFAIKIRSIGQTEGSLKLDFTGITSIGYDIDENKIQKAYEYSVSKISYINSGIETSDIKDTLGIIYGNQHFSYSFINVYNLVNNVPFGMLDDSNSTVVIYFDLYFDPTIYGQTSEGVSHENSNIFMNQIFVIQHIYMTIS